MLGFHSTIFRDNTLYPRLHTKQYYNVPFNLTMLHILAIPTPTFENSPRNIWIF